ncbi:contactin-associated protein-like 4 [Clavelina lepadiformis]|uniref:contactin-associated protein-like 4 n=1 Tax=Clavelina lepadiformis TaxID=159417 RepID=UPI00404193CF
MNPVFFITVFFVATLANIAADITENKTETCSGSGYVINNYIGYSPDGQPIQSRESSSARDSELKDVLATLIAKLDILANHSLSMNQRIDDIENRFGTQQDEDQLEDQFSSLEDELSTKITYRTKGLYRRVNAIEDALSKRIDIYQTPASCDQINGTENDSGYYLISPDPPRILPFSIYCNFTGKKYNGTNLSDPRIISIPYSPSNKLAPSILPPTCASIFNKTAEDSGIYVISPDPGSVTPFTVYCNFSGEPTTVINHDSTGEIKVGKCSSGYCYERNVRYGLSMKQIVAMISRSMHCRQFVKYRCKSSLLRGYGRWTSRNGGPKYYWGGATSQRSYYCACGETRTCVGGTSYNCNCDWDQLRETFDEGYLTDKEDLPVIALFFGDTDGSNEDGWHTLGPLQCTGRCNH